MSVDEMKIADSPLLELLVGIPVEQAVEIAGYVDGAKERARRQTFIEAAAMAEKEPEPKGKMPFEFLKMDKEEIVRATVRATRASIAARLRQKAEDKAKSAVLEKHPKAIEKMGGIIDGDTRKLLGYTWEEAYERMKE